VLDRAGLIEAVEPELRRRGFETVRCERVTDALHALRGKPVDAVIAGIDLGGMSGLELSRRVFADHEGLPVLLLVPGGDPDLVDAATLTGAFSVLSAPVDAQVLELTLDRAVEHMALRREVRRLERVVQDGFGLEDLLGNSPVMRRLFDLIERAANSRAPVLITGQSGTGKERVARTLHSLGPRSDGPFVAVNTSAIPDALLESELFGHARGAFTDARSARQGLFLQASGGTLFLDEIGEVGLSLQPKLLRALQERVVRPVGSDREIPFDARIIAATNRDLEHRVSQGTFREDLYYRLNVIHIDLPPLSSRGSDVLLLARHFLEVAAGREDRPMRGISNAAAQRLLDYRWPGNVRELENCIERAVALSRNQELQVEDLPDRIRGYRPSHVLVAAEDPTELVTMAVVEERYIRRVLKAVKGNKSEAARLLGFDRKTLYRKMRRYGIEGA
jgi:two-component system response regulator AtoC